MAYIKFQKEVGYVLDAFELAVVFNEYIRKFCHNEDPFEDGEFDDNIHQATSRGFAVILADDQFDYWSIEPVGNAYKYDAEEIVIRDTPLFFVKRRNMGNVNVLGTDYLSYRKYEFRYAFKEE